MRNATVISIAIISTLTLSACVSSPDAESQRLDAESHRPNVSARKADIVAVQEACAEADATLKTLGNADVTNISAVRQKNLRASRILSNCALAQLHSGHTRVALAYIAASLHALNVVAMSMHMEGDDSGAQTLVSQLRSEEARYLVQANDNGYAESVTALKAASGETEAIAARLQ